MATPAERYHASDRAYPCGPIAYPLHDDVIKVHASGHTAVTRCRDSSFFLSTALAGESVAIRQLGDQTWLLAFAYLNLGVYDAAAHMFQSVHLAGSTPLGS